MTRLIYSLGAAVTAILTLIFLSRAEFVPFPDAMLPMQIWELASIWLALGFLPMTAAAILFYRLKRRRIIFVPAAVCAGFLIFWLNVAVRI